MKAKQIVAFAVASLSLAAMAQGKKIVSFAWEWQRNDPAMLLALQPQIYAAGLDGIGVVYSFKQGGAVCSSKGICTESWNYESMRPLAAEFRRVLGKPGLTDCFANSFYAPTNRFDWTDDAAWARFGANMRLAARFAKESGCVGLKVDHEDYKYQRQFDRLPGDPPMEELEGLVRRRGREMFEAVFEEFPEAKIFFFWFMSEHAHGFNGIADPLQALRLGNKLWAFFANGIIDAMPPGARIYDGNEYSYEFKSGDMEYIVQANAIRRMDGFAYPENREKYHRQVFPSAALYLDMYCQTNSADQWYKPPFNGTRLGMYRRDLKQALDSVDEYLWTWSQWKPYVRRAKDPKGMWPDAVWRGKTFDELMPGFNRATVAIKDPVRFLDEVYPAMMAATNAPLSLVSPDFSPNGWQKKNRAPGVFVGDDEVFGASAPSVRLEGIAHGCVMKSVSDVKAGEIYAVRLKAKAQAGGFNAHVGWQRGGKWRFFEPVTTLSFGEPDARGWRAGRAVATVPENVDKLVLQFNVNQDPGEKCWVDDAEIVRVE